MRFGLSAKNYNLIVKAIAEFPEIRRAAVFGSRAMGNYKPGSDVDIALFGTNVTDSVVNRLSSLLNEELPLPYFFDVLHYRAIQNLELKKHIDKEGRLLFDRETGADSLDISRSFS